MVDLEHSDLFRFSCFLLKYFGYGLLGFMIAIVLFGTFGLGHVSALMLSLLGPWLVKLAILLGCMLAAGAIIESLRH